MKSRKGMSAALSTLAGFVMVLLVLAVILGLGQQMLDGFYKVNCDGVSGLHYNTTDGRCVNAAGVPGPEADALYSYAINNTVDGFVAVDQVSGFQTTIAVILVAAAILGILTYLLVKQFS